MICAGCNTDAPPAAYALMRDTDIAALGIEPAVRGPGLYHAVPVCRDCFVNPEHRAHPLKAHFTHPDTVELAVGRAGSSDLG